MEVNFYGTLKVSAIIHDLYNSMMRHYLKEVKYVRNPNRDLSKNFLARISGQTPGIKLSANQAPKSDHAASTLAPQSMPDWHLKVPARHLDKPLHTGKDDSTYTIGTS